MPRVFETPTANQIGKRGEKATSKQLDGRLVSGSGCGRMKGDIEHGSQLIEHKSTKARSMKLDKEWLEKIEKQAFQVGKEPVLVLEFQETMPWYCQRWALIPLDRLQELLESEGRAE